MLTPHGKWNGSGKKVMLDMRNEKQAGSQHE